jgi:hypothetical protein
MMFYTLIMPEMVKKTMAASNYRTEVVVLDSKIIDDNNTTLEKLNGSMLNIKAESVTVCFVDGKKYLDGVPKRITVLEVTDVEFKGKTEYYELSGFRGMTWITEYHVVIYARSAKAFKPDNDMCSKIDQFRLNAYMEE